MSTFGHAGATVGARFRNRREVQAAGLHRHNQKGISGDPVNGADAVVLSGGYANEEDYGDLIVYVGEGGIDRDTGQNIADQHLTGGNLALVKSCTDGLPVRVIRGRTRRTRHPSPWTPDAGYRYDGLFRVDSYWDEVPPHGFRIYRYRLVAVAAHPPAPAPSVPAP
jgi:putative restriction endonuclease